MFHIVDLFEVDDAISAIRRWGQYSREDEFFYHVTTEQRAVRIRATGLKPDVSHSMDSGFYREYSRGKIFFCEKGGVSYWIGRISDHLENQFDEPPKMAVIKFSKDIVHKFQEDELGTRDSHSNSYFSTEPIVAARKQK